MLNMALLLLTCLLGMFAWGTYYFSFLSTWIIPIIAEEFIVTLIKKSKSKSFLNKHKNSIGFLKAESLVKDDILLSADELSFDNKFFVLKKSHWEHLPTDLVGRYFDSVSSKKMFAVRILDDNNRSLLFHRPHLLLTRLFNFATIIWSFGNEQKTSFVVFQQVLQIIWNIFLISHKMKINKNDKEIKNKEYKLLFPPCDFVKKKFYCLSDCYFTSDFIPKDHKSKFVKSNDLNNFKAAAEIIRNVRSKKVNENVAFKYMKPELLDDSLSRINKLLKNSKVYIDKEQMDNFCLNNFTIELVRLLKRSKFTHFSKYLADELTRNSKHDRHRFFNMIDDHMYKLPEIIGDYELNRILGDLLLVFIRSCLLMKNESKGSEIKFLINDLSELEDFLFYNDNYIIKVENFSSKRCHFVKELNFKEFVDCRTAGSIRKWLNSGSNDDEDMLVSFMHKMVEEYYDLTFKTLFNSNKEKQMILFVLSIVGAVHFQLKKPEVVIDRMIEVMKSKSYFNKDTNENFPNSRWKTFFTATDNFFENHLNLKGFIGKQRSNCNHNRIFDLMVEAKKDFEFHTAEKQKNNMIVTVDNVEICGRPKFSKSKLKKIQKHKSNTVNKLTLYNNKQMIEKTNYLSVNYNIGRFVNLNIENLDLALYNKLSKDCLDSFPNFKFIVEKAEGILNTPVTFSAKLSGSKLDRKLKNLKSKNINMTFYLVEDQNKEKNYNTNILNAVTKYPYDSINDLKPPELKTKDFYNSEFCEESTRLCKEKIEFYKKYKPLGLYAGKKLINLYNKISTRYKSNSVRKYEKEKLYKVLNNFEKCIELCKIIVQQGYYFSEEKYISVVNNLKTIYKHDRKALIMIRKLCSMKIKQSP